MGDPWGPPRKRSYELQPEVREVRVDSSGMQIPIQRDQQIKIWDTVMPVMVVDPAAPTQGMSGGPKARALVNTSGEVTETNSASINANTVYLQNTLYGLGPPVGVARSSGALLNYQRILIQSPFTLAGGVLADMELVPAVAAKQGCMAITGLNASSADTYILTFQDEDDAALPQTPSRWDAVVGTAYVPVMLEQPLFFKHAADEKAIEVDISGGAGAETGTIYGYYWYET